jgi:hypothetical protein
MSIYFYKYMYLYSILMIISKKNWVDLILRFTKSVMKNISLSIETLPTTERIICLKCNTHIKSRI